MCDWEWDTEFVKTFVVEMKHLKFSPWYTARKLTDALKALDKKIEEVIE